MFVGSHVVDTVAWSHFHASQLGIVLIRVPVCSFLLCMLWRAASVLSLH
jgi:hypothetical protein